MQNMAKNRMVLNQTEGIFQGFNRKEFGPEAVHIYNLVAEFYKSQNKLELRNYLSYPLYNVLITSYKDKNLVLPFKFDKAISASLYSARIFSNDASMMNKLKSWHQLTCVFQMENDLGETFEKINVFERREVDAAEGFWRLCYLS